MENISLEKYLHSLSACNVLDIATGSGFFAEVLKDNLNSWQTITGIDQKPFDEKKMPVFTQTGLTYRQMQATHLDFAENSFDLVTLSNSIHHFAEPELVFTEMKRVAKPDGTFIVFEMYNDNQSQPQQNAVQLHQWWAKLNRANGIFHDPRYNRADLVSLLRQVFPIHWEFYDIPPEEEDPFDAETMAFIEENIAENIKTAQVLPSGDELIAEGKNLLEKIHQSGHISATELLAIGKRTG
jgi:SAM-dependent methyltransferase